MPTSSAANQPAGKHAVSALLNDVVGSVDQLPATALRDIYPALVAAEKETAQAFDQWLSKHPDNGARYTAHRHRQLLLQLRKARSEALKRLRKEPTWTKDLERTMHQGLRKASWRGGELATEHIQRELATFDSVFGHGMTPIELDRAAIMARGDRLLVPRHESSARRYAGNVWRDMKAQLAVSVVSNETIDQMTNRLMRLGRGTGAAGSAGEAVAGSLFGRYRYQAERVARTETIHSYNVQADEALHEAHSIDPDIRRRWDSSLDSRLCRVCSALHGEVVEVGKPFSDGTMFPPAHPNCRCAVVAWRDDWANDMEEQTSAQMLAFEEEKRRERMLQEAKQRQLAEQEEARRKKQEAIKAAAKAKREAAKKAVTTKRAEVRQAVQKKAAPAALGGAESLGRVQRLLSGRKADIEKVFARARAEMEKDFKDQRGMRKHGTKKQVVMRDLRKVAGQKGWDCQVRLTPDMMHKSSKFGTLVADPENLAKFRRFNQLNNLYDEGTITVAQQKEFMKLRKDMAVKLMDKNADGYRVFVHEVLHGFGPVKAEGYRNHGAIIEEVTTEFMARGEMRDAFGRPLYKGCYKKWINPYLDFVEQHTVVGDVEEHLLEASRRFRMRQEKSGDPMRIRSKFADDIADTIGIAPKDRAAFKRKFNAFTNDLIKQSPHKSK